MLGENPSKAASSFAFFKLYPEEEKGSWNYSSRQKKRDSSLSLFLPLCTNKCIQLNPEHRGLHVSFFGVLVVVRTKRGIVGRRGGVRGRMTETFLLF